MDVEELIFRNAENIAENTKSIASNAQAIAVMNKSIEETQRIVQHTNNNAKMASNAVADFRVDNVKLSARIENIHEKLDSAFTKNKSPKTFTQFLTDTKVLIGIVITILGLYSAYIAHVNKVAEKKASDQLQLFTSEIQSLNKVLSVNVPSKS